MKENLKQYLYKIIEFRYYIKYRKKIPKGIRRAMIELVISLGQLTVLHGNNILDDSKAVDGGFDIAIRKHQFVGKYIDYLIQERKEKQ